MESPNFVAAGYVAPSRIVVLDSAADNAAGATLAGSMMVFEAGSNAAETAAVAAGTSTAGLFQNDTAATATSRPQFGISMPGTDYPPINDSHVTVGNYAAVPGEDLQVYGPGQYGFLELAGTVAHGQRIKANYTSTSASDGRGVAVGAYDSANPQQYVGYAQQSGVSGNKILVFIAPGVF